MFVRKDISAAQGGLPSLPLTTRDDMIEAVVSWCDALAGKTGIDDALALLLRGVGAEAGMILRCEPNGTSKVAVHDRLARSVVRPLCQSFAEGQFGHNLMRSRGGTVWFSSSDTDRDVAPDPALSDWQGARGLSEFAVIILDGAGHGRDRIELHFREMLSTVDQKRLALLAATLARTWAQRQVGVVSGVIFGQRGASGPQTRAEPILGLANPARLSRAEFRVCLLLSRGLSVAGVVAELSLSEATVRSHLRNIYAKTGTSGLTQLVYRLMAPGTYAPSDRRASGLH